MPKEACSCWALTIQVPPWPGAIVCGMPQRGVGAFSSDRMCLAKHLVVREFDRVRWAAGVGQAQFFEIDRRHVDQTAGAGDRFDQVEDAIRTFVLDHVLKADGM